MEFRLNKIDTDLRQQINEETREGKVHSKKGITINKDKGENKRQGKQQHKEPKEKFSLSKYEGRAEKIAVDAVKVENVEVEASKEENAASENTYKGRFIDIRR